MDRYVIREARIGTNYPQGNQMMTFSTNTGKNYINPTETVYYGGAYANQFTNMQPVPNSNYIDIGNVNTPVIGQNLHPAQGQMMTGIDPRYLANYADNSAQYIVAGQPMQCESGNMPNNPSFGSNYQNRSFTGVEKSKPKMFTQGMNTVRRPELPQQMFYDRKTNADCQPKEVMQKGITQEHQIKATPKVVPIQASKKEYQSQIMSRTDRLQALHKSGPRAFSGPVEKVLKWHKALQDIGVFVFYEIVAKCVSVRSGESCSKNLVIRDDNGPAMQVVYYEIDFLLPELKVPSTVRVIGRMMAGTCRLQAFSVRPATGDDVTMLPRRAVVAAHQVTKLCKEYGINISI
ncbi:unnamed protein product [Arctia plantaginis]|uniref:Uncharacterized protein n=1 Tax=Arctia plantaginis TaxID=874455 RepID=A0A8S0ZT71_ARCPL|nr:unnamed protein product [Arctia plantaginis]